MDEAKPDGERDVDLRGQEASLLAQCRTSSQCWVQCAKERQTPSNVNTDAHAHVK